MDEKQTSFLVRAREFIFLKKSRMLLGKVLKIK